MYKLKTVLTMFLTFCCITLTYAQDGWVGKAPAIKDADGKALFINDGDLYLATAHAIYRCNDSKEGWRSIFSLPSGENEITCLAGSPKRLFVGTKRGLFRSQDFGRSWKNVFRTIMPEKSNINCIATTKASGNAVFIGTERGIFATDDGGEHWADVSGCLKNRVVRCIEPRGGVLYAGSDAGLYVKTGQANQWQRLYVKAAPERPEAEEPADDQDVENEEDENLVSCMAHDGKRLYAGVDTKILYIEDGSASWKTFPSEGLAGSINFIVVADGCGKLYCATTKGVFEFSEDSARWRELYKGKGKSMNVRQIAMDANKPNIMWAVGDRGLFTYELGKYADGGFVDIEKGMQKFYIISKNEPSYQELQKAAIRFADLSPEKTRGWQSQSRVKALLPKVSVGLDDNRSSTYSFYSSSTKNYIMTGPDDITKGWDVSVSWELGDLIWSTDQTSIDVRSRLTTQLRNDILDDLRRVYYERKRLQYELIAQPPNDMKVRFEKEMRLDELTRTIDDLTGNYLSAHIQDQREKR